jgi:hypothetical protein
VADGIQPNPLLALLPEVQDVSAVRPDDPLLARAWTSINSLAAFARAIANLFEFHIETIASTGTVVPHRLRRRPFGLVLLWQDANRVAVVNHELWTDEKVVISTSSFTMRICFVLF